MKHSVGPVRSMTGFGSWEGCLEVPEGGLAGGPGGDQRVRLELRSVNHRMLDIKLRLPREYQAAETLLRQYIQTRISRGSLELRLEQIKAPGEPAVELLPDLEAARRAYHALSSIRESLGLQDEIRTIDLLNFPEVLSRKSPQELDTQTAWKLLEPEVSKVIASLLEMREKEGQTLAVALLKAISDIEAALDRIRLRKGEQQSAVQQRIRERMKAAFDSFPAPVSESAIAPILESRIAQEVASLLDRTDIEEEVTRFQGHLEHLRSCLSAGGQIGRKLEFLLQELGREINTLSNKAQDFKISQEAVQVKLKLEQIREQVLNLE